MLILKPAGRGNWHPITLRIEGRGAEPMLFRVGQQIVFGGLFLRVCEVRP